jgi:hypothetical protein
MIGGTWILHGAAAANYPEMNVVVLKRLRANNQSNPWLTNAVLNANLKYRVFGLSMMLNFTKEDLSSWLVFSGIMLLLSSLALGKIICLRRGVRLSNELSTALFA